MKPRNTLSNQRIAVIAVFLSIISSCHISASADMTDLGTLGGSYAYTYGVSGDGTTIVGGSQITGDTATHAFKCVGTTMTDLGTLGGTYSYAYAASNNGSVIVGYSQTTGNAAYRAFKYTGTSMTSLGTLGGTSSYANGISSDGNVILGYSSITGDSATHAFSYTGTTMTDLATLGGTNSYAYTASSNGSVIIGYSQITGDSANHAFKYSGGSMTDLGTLGGSDSYAEGISANGSVIVGYSYLSGNSITHAFKYSGTSMTDIGTLGGSDSYAKAVSADGSIIAGYSQTSGGAYHAFRYAGSSMTDIGTLGGNASYATGISADGTVITGYSDITGNMGSHVFIYRGGGTIVDADNTRTAIANNGAQLNSLINMKTSLLSNMLDYDCAFYSEKGICLSLSGWHYSGQETSRAAQTASTLKASYRFGKTFRAGVSADLAFEEINPTNFHTSRTPLLGAFAALGDNETGNGPQLKVSLAYSKNAATITRSTLDNTEAGQGDSTLHSFGTKAELGYGIANFLGWMPTPYVGIRWTNVSRDGYTETSGATFPVSYNNIRQRQLTGIAGLRVERKLFSVFGVGAGIGVEQDFHNDMNGYNGTMSSLGDFNMSAPDITKTRPYGNLSAYCGLGKHQRIGVGAEARRQSIGTTYGTLISGQYTVAF